MDYELNKGIGESAEFKGLKAQYLFIFAGGLLALFVLFVILYMAGIGQWLCIAFGVTSTSVLLERQVRRTWADEAVGQETAPPLPDQPNQSPKVIHD